MFPLTLSAFLIGFQLISEYSGSASASGVGGGVFRSMVRSIPKTLNMVVMAVLVTQGCGVSITTDWLVLG